MNCDLYQLAQKAVLTPSLDAFGSLQVLSDVLLEQGAIENPDEAHDWARREVRPQYVAEGGSWDVEIVGVEERESFRVGPFVLVLFRRDDSHRVFAYVVKIQRTSLGWRYRFPPDAGIEPVLRAGRGRLETKKIRTKIGTDFMRHTWLPA